VVDTPDGPARSHGDPLRKFEAIPGFEGAVAELFG